MMNTPITTIKSWVVLAISALGLCAFSASAATFTAPVDPVVQTIYATNISATSAVLPAQVNPMNNPGSIYFEYGPMGSFSLNTSAQSMGVGSYERIIRAQVNNLQPGTAYTYRVVVMGANGILRGNALTFTTLGTPTGSSANTYGTYNPANPITSPTSNAPSANFGRTMPAIYVNGTSASLKAMVNPQNTTGLAYYFEYGTDESFNEQTNTTSAGVGGYDRMVGASVSDLAPGTTYSFRVVFQTPQGTVRGESLGFTTAGSRPVAVTVARTTTTANSNSSATRTTAAATGNTPKTTTSGSGTSSGTASKLAAGTANVANSTGSWFSNLWDRLTGKNRTVATNNTNSTGTAVSAPTPAANVGPTCASVNPTLTSPKLVSNTEALYAIRYRNNCAFPLTNATLTVRLPAEVDFLSTDYPFIVSDGNALTYTLGTVAPATELAVSIRTTVKQYVKQGDTLTIGAMLSFAGEQGRSESVSTLSANRVTAGVSFFASLGETVRNIFGRWFVSLILICAILGLLFWHFFRERRKDNVEDLVLNIERI